MKKIFILIPVLFLSAACGGKKQANESVSSPADSIEMQAADTTDIGMLEKNAQDLNERSKSVEQEIDSLLNTM